MKTKLILRWERGEENSVYEWERENDGVLYGLLSALVRVMELSAEPMKGGDTNA